MTSDDLIIEWLQGRADQEGHAELKRWRSLSPENEARFQEVSWLWSVCGEAELVLPQVPQADEILPQSEAVDIVPTEADPSPADPELFPISDWRKPTRHLPPSHRGWKTAALAASLAAVGLLGGWIGRAIERPQALFNREVSTGQSGGVTLALSDGSSVRLGPHSRLQILSLDETSGERVVWLEGRAFLGVHHDPSHPFVVRTSQGDAVALGTRFEVRAERTGLEVVVVEGLVKVGDGDESVTLSQGDLGRVNSDGTVETEQVEDLYGRLGWLSNVLVLQETPLGQAVKEIEARFGVDVEVEDPALNELTLTTTFTDRPVEEILAVICEVLAAQCNVAPDGSVHMKQLDGTFLGGSPDPQDSADGT